MSLPSQERINAMIRTTIGDLMVQNLLLTAQLEEAQKTIAELQQQSPTEVRPPLNGGHGPKQDSVRHSE